MKFLLSQIMQGASPAPLPRGEGLLFSLHKRFKPGGVELSFVLLSWHLLAKYNLMAEGTGYPCLGSLKLHPGPTSKNWEFLGEG